MVFRDRRDAGRHLAQELPRFAGIDALVLGLPRGGVVVAAEVAAALEAELDVCVTRKLGAPHNPELAFGAIGPDGVRVLNHDVVRMLRISEDVIEDIVAKERVELERRLAHYRGGRPLPRVGGRTVIVVDDGLATGATARAALQVVRVRDPKRLVLAVPVGAPSTVAAFKREAHEVVCPHQPPQFMAVGQWYEDFDQTTDAEVLALLARAETD